MSRETLLARAQAAAVAGMADACTIRRVTGTVTDDFSGTVTPTYASLYAGKCRVQQRLAQSTQEDAGEDYLQLLRLEVQLPMSVTGLEVNDQITITASVDADLAGRTFLIRDLFHKSEASARRVQCIERTAS
jgi:hypothetical protein